LHRKDSRSISNAAAHAFSMIALRNIKEMNLHVTLVVWY